LVTGQTGMLVTVMRLLLASRKFNCWNIALAAFVKNPSALSALNFGTALAVQSRSNIAQAQNNRFTQSSRDVRSL
jgi:hypothetical protein